MTGRRKAAEHCSNCGGTEFVEAVDNEGQKYMGCARCVIVIPPELKRAHVARAKQTRPHTCHWPGCTLQVPPAMWGCKAHWFALPKHIRDRIWAAYVPGQEERGDPSVAYLAAATLADEWIAGVKKDGGER